MSSNWRAKAPGKLMIAGEYAVLEPNQHAIVAAVNRYVIADVERSQLNLVTLPDLDLHEVEWKIEGTKVVFSRSDPRLFFLGEAISVTNQVRQEKGLPMESFSVTISSQLSDRFGRKYGLGSSAAIVVAGVTAILSFYKIKLSRLQLFKLAAIAHLRVQGNGSCADIAASTFGGWLDYSSFDSKWVVKQLDEGMKITELLEVPWPNLSFSSLIPLPHLKLCVGWTDEVARTGPMVDKYHSLRDQQRNAYRLFLKESSDAVTKLRRSFSLLDYNGAVESLMDNRNALLKFGALTGVLIETPMLTRLCRIADRYGSGKFSGAGGGDCGIAFVTNDYQLEQLHMAWEKAGILPLHLKVSYQGCSVTETRIPSGVK